MKAPLPQARQKNAKNVRRLIIDVYIGLGSNLGCPTRQLHRAIKALRSLPRTSVEKISPMYLSRPSGPVHAQPLFYNQVVKLKTTLFAHHLLHLCQAIEKKQHRRKTHVWGARTVDLDILLYGDKMIHSHDLIIPHPHMLQRDFVLKPLLDITPSLCDSSGVSLKTYLERCERHVLDYPKQSARL